MNLIILYSEHMLIKINKNNEASIQEKKEYFQ